MNLLSRWLASIVAIAALQAAAEPAQWQRMRVDINLTTLEAGRSDGRTVLVTRGNQPALRSNDGGQTWVAFDFPAAHPVQFLSAPGDERIFYALVGDRELTIAPPGRALYRSSDRGLTWQLLSPRIQTPDGQVIDQLSVGADPNLLYGSRMVASACLTASCTFDGAEAWVSSDGGRSWRLADPDPAHHSRRAYPAASEAKVAYATASSGLYRTDDQAQTWQLVLASSSVDAHQVVVDNKDPMTVYVSIGPGTDLRVTEDGGLTWRAAETIDVPGPVHNLLADPLEAGRVYFLGTEGEVFESRDRARTWHRVAPSSGGFVQVLGAPPVVGMDGSRRVFYALGLGGVIRLDVEDGAFTLGSDLWWNPAQSGWGLTLTQHASGDLFGVWFGYDKQGSAVWRVMPGGTWNGRTFSATLYETRGPAYFAAPYDPSRVVINRVGEATLAFADDNTATFAYRLDDGTSVSTPITRQAFGDPGEWHGAISADLWANPAEPGWGVAVNQQFGEVLAVWFVYDAAGRPVWAVMPTSMSAYTTDNTYFPAYRGDVYTASGPPEGAPFDPSQVAVTRAGSGSITFWSRNEGLAQLTISGSSVRKPLERQPF